MDIFEDIGNADELLCNYYNNVLATLRGNKMPSTRSCIDDLLDYDVLKKNEDVAIVLIFGIINVDKNMRIDFKNKLKRKHNNFNISKFFALLNVLCEHYITEHEDDAKFIRQLNRTYNICKESNNKNKRLKIRHKEAINSN
jgi:hypothetical protein